MYGIVEYAVVVLGLESVYRDYMKKFYDNLS